MSSKNKMERIVMEISKRDFYHLASAALCGAVAGAAVSGFTISGGAVLAATTVIIDKLATKIFGALDLKVGLQRDLLRNAFYGATLMAMIPVITTVSRLAGISLPLFQAYCAAQISNTFGSTLGHHIYVNIPLLQPYLPSYLSRYL